VRDQRKLIIRIKVEPPDLAIVPIFRLHLPDYNEAAWWIDGRELYPEFKNYSEYRAAFEQEAK